MVNRTSLEIINLLKTGQIEIGFINMPLHDEAITIQECLQVLTSLYPKKKIIKYITYMNSHKNH